MMELTTAISRIIPLRAKNALQIMSLAASARETN